MATLAAGNVQNNLGNQTSNVMTDVDGTYQYGVLIRLDFGCTVFKRDLSLDETDPAAYTTYDVSANATALANGIVPLTSTTDVHYGWAIAVDDQDRVHLWGNSLASTPH